MNDEEILRKKYGNDIKIEPVVEDAEHYYSVTIDGDVVDVFVDGDKVRPLPRWFYGRLL